MKFYNEETTNFFEVEFIDDNRVEWTQYALEDTKKNYDEDMDAYVITAREEKEIMDYIDEIKSTGYHELGGPCKMIGCVYLNGECVFDADEFDFDGEQ